MRPFFGSKPDETGAKMTFREFLRDFPEQTVEFVRLGAYELDKSLWKIPEFSRKNAHNFSTEMIRICPIPATNESCEHQLRRFEGVSRRDILSSSHSRRFAPPLFSLSLHFSAA